jgi:flagellar FliJ protein
VSKFKFKLQKLLDIKIKDEEESKLRYTQAQNKKRVTEESLKGLKLNYEKYSDLSKPKDIVTQKITINYLASLTQTIKETNENLKKQETKVHEAKEDFIQRQIKRKSLETLKENALEKLIKEEERVEQITNDEFALYAYMRNVANLL